MRKNLIAIAALAFVLGGVGLARSQSRPAIDTSNPIQTRPNVAPVFVEENPKPEKEKQPDPPSAELPVTALDTVPVEKLDETLRKLDKFAKLNNDTHIVTFDSKAARAAGFETEEIKLAEELYQLLKTK